MKLFRILWYEIKGDLKETLIYAGLMALFFFWFVTLFDPELTEGLETAFEAYPESMKEMIGGQLALSKFEGFMHLYLFSMAWFYFGLYFVMKASSDIPNEIEKKTIDLMLSKPIKRWEFSLGKYFSHVLAAFIVVVSVYIAIIIGVTTLPNVDANNVDFERLSVAFILLTALLVALISTSFFFSTFLETRKALVMSLGVMIFYYIIWAFTGLFDENIEDIQYLSVFYYFDTSDLLLDDNWDNIMRNMMILWGYSITLVAISIIIFNKRDIPA